MERNTVGDIIVENENNAQLFVNERNGILNLLPTRARARKIPKIPRAPNQTGQEKWCWKRMAMAAVAIDPMEHSTQARGWLCRLGMAWEVLWFFRSNQIVKKNALPTTLLRENEMRRGARHNHKTHIRSPRSWRDRTSRNCTSFYR
jgi:hypothetical protein